MHQRILPALGLSTLLGLGSLILAAPAQAAGTGTVALGSYLQYKAAKGKKNKLVVTRTGNKITFDDTVSLKAGKGCKAVSGHKTVVTCTVSNPGTVIVTLGDKNDSFVNKTSLRFNVYGGSGNDKLTGGSGIEMLDGGTGSDKLYGNAGDDLLRGKSGNDLLDGGDGYDRLEGAEGNDTLVGRTGRDSIDGAAGKDVVWAGAGDDQILDGPGKSTDVFHGGTGFDRLSYLGRTKSIIADADGRSGDDGESGERDTIDLDVEGLEGSRGNDRLTGNASANVLLGNGGDDVLIGLGGNDLLEGWSGKDTLDGGAGDDEVDGGFDNDTLTGGPGADLVVGGDGFDRLTGADGDDKLYGWIVPAEPDDGPPVEHDPDDDRLGGALDGGAGADFCLEGKTGTRVNCES
jgi:Ca2+-binding RTX toxin-like protein